MGQSTESPGGGSEQSLCQRWSHRERRVSRVQRRPLKASLLGRVLPRTCGASQHPLARPAHQARLCSGRCREAGGQHRLQRARLGPAARACANSASGQVRLVYTCRRQRGRIRPLRPSGHHRLCHWHAMCRVLSPLVAGRCSAHCPGCTFVSVSVRSRDTGLQVYGLCSWRRVGHAGHRGVTLQQQPSASAALA